MITDYHAQLFANELSLRAPLGTVERLAAALMNTRVDLNPHQVDAAVFAFSSPLSRGALLADEVGLGKTIEAGILIAQRWAEKKRRILIIVPANLRKQWQIELEEKFSLSAKILECKSFNEAIKNGNLNPFNCDEIVITSYAFARNKEAYLKQTPWDLAVIDEAHRLRNVYKSGNKMGTSIKSSLQSAPKILLTATPLQNNLMELYGLVGIIDPHVFGDEKSFRELFINNPIDTALADLRDRLSHLCKRTLRKQVLKYIKYTKRHVFTQEFYSTKTEEKLYEQISEYLRRDALKALPNGQRKLMTMILRKLLASSSFAIAGTLETLVARLELMLKDGTEQAKLDVSQDFETADEYSASDEFDDDEDDESFDGDLPSPDQPDEPLSESEINAIKSEIADLKSYLSLAQSIRQNAKGEALLASLKSGFAMAENLGGARKAVIFTESRRTQDYIWQILSENGYDGKLMLFNGTNSDETSKRIYNDWKAKNPNRITASKSADMRTALVEHFRYNAQIMIATEAAAEGINLQFCSLVVNYDLPWNPQRIEQRIGRCHRYGQKYDVVVMNFLNLNNEADQRVYEILNEKLHLFEGVFGASDEILGALGNGLDFERKIAEIYQKCRTSAQIQMEFDFIQTRFSLEIAENIRKARRKLLENFDAEVAERLNVFHEASHATIDKLQAILWALTKYELSHQGVFFDEENLTFQMLNETAPDFVDKKLYAIKWNGEYCQPYGITHPIAQKLIARAANRDLPYCGVLFDYENTIGKISVIEQLPKKSGKLMLSKITIGTTEPEEHLVFTCVDDLGNQIDPDTARRFFNLNARTYDLPDAFDSTHLEPFFESQKAAIIADNAEKTAKQFDAEVEKLERWSEDRKTSLDLKIKEIDKQIRDLKKNTRNLHTLDEKIANQRNLRAAETERMNLRRKLFAAQDAIDDERDKLIASAEKSLTNKITSKIIFAIEWRIV